MRQEAWLLGDTNYTTGKAGTSIASGLAQLVSSLSKVIWVSVNHDRPPNNAVRPRKTDLGICDGDLGYTVVASNHVAQVSNMPVCVGRCTMFLAQWIEMGTRTRAAVRVVPKLMDVEAVKALLQAGDFPRDHDWLVRARLSEINGSGGLLRALENTNSLHRHRN